MTGWGPGIGDPGAPCTSSAGGSFCSGLAGLEQQMRALSQSIETLHDALARATHSLSSMLPIHFAVERLDVEKLEFHLDRIDVEELSGELNIGLTHILKAGGGQGDAGSGQGLTESGSGRPPSAQPVHKLWPPEEVDSTP